MKIPTLLAALVLLSCGPQPSTNGQPLERTTSDSPFLIQGALDYGPNSMTLYRVKDKKTGECFIIFRESQKAAMAHIPNSKEMP